MTPQYTKNCLQENIPSKQEEVAYYLFHTENFQLRRPEQCLTDEYHEQSGHTESLLW